MPHILWPPMTYRKIGGLRYLRVGNLGVCFWRYRR